MLLFRAGFCSERIRLPDSNSRIEICKANSSGVEPRFRGLLRIEHNNTFVSVTILVSVTLS